jgi:hypothetical protein
VDWWFTDGLWATDYEVARFILQRGVAALFLVAFLSSLNQFPVLLGERGLLPATELLKHPAHLRGPTLFRRLRYTDARLRLVCVVGMVIAAALVAGLPQLGPPWVPMIAFLALYGLYMSIVHIGQTFYGFGWEMLILEAGFLVAFLGSNDQPPATTILVLNAWLVFRLEFGAGMIKIRGGREWRDLTALMYHHETQPMPGPLSRQAHLLPAWFHRGEVLGNHFAQLVVPWLLFAPQPVASIAAAVVVLTQLWLVITGNFAWLNWITIVLACGAISDRVIEVVLPWVFAPPLPEPAEGPIWWLVVTLLVTGLLVVLSWWPLRNLFARRQLMNAAFNRWQLGNAYGAFGTVTKRRIEVVIEGAVAADPGPENWRAYEFKGKPGDVRRVPRQWAPYHLRLDWLMWFLPLGTVHERWLYALLEKLLQADAVTLRLLRIDPFDGVPPRWIRVRTYHYRFSTRAEFRETGQRWIRTPRQVVIAPVGLPGRS